MISKSRSILVSLSLPFVALGTLFLVFVLYSPTQAKGGTYVVNTTADTNDGNCNAAHCTLREAILAANSTAEADTITFSLPPSATITLNGTQLPVITGTLTIDGSTAVNLTISGDNASRVFVIGSNPPGYLGPNETLAQYRFGATSTVTLTNLHITEGNDTYRGGGIYNHGNLIVMNSTLSHLASKYGGIYNDQSLTITNTVFISNSMNTLYGGGAGIFNAITGTATVMNSTFISNSANVFDGGAGIYNLGTLIVNTTNFNGNIALVGSAINSRGTLSVNNSTFSNNKGSGAGGAIFSMGMANITNSVFNNNRVGGDSFTNFNMGELIAGGAITHFEDTMTISNSVFIGNSATDTINGGIGGAIYAGALDTLNVSGSTFNNNYAGKGQTENAGGLGGAIAAFYRLNVDNSIFEGNFAGVEGGAIKAENFVNITDGTFENNFGGHSGGGISLLSGGATIKNSSFHGNSVSGTHNRITGGGIASISGLLTLMNSTVSGNIISGTAVTTQTLAGGGIYNEYNPLIIINSTVSDNLISGMAVTSTKALTMTGGGIYVHGYLTLTNSTLSGNAVVSDGDGVISGGGIYVGPISELRSRNSIIANSQGGDCAVDGTIVVNINNLIEDGSCNPLLSGDPLLGPLQDNGGDTWTQALLFGSPAIDAGHSATCSTEPVSNLDQRGEIRPLDGDGDGLAVCDIGAYEAALPNLSLVKNAPAVVAAGAFITYTLTAVNNLTTTITNVVLTDTIPTNATYISGGTLVGNVVSWTLPSLAVGETFTRSFVVTATQTITNHDYRISAAGGYSTTGSIPVVTLVVEPITGLSATNDSPTTIGSMTTFMASVTTGDDVSYVWAFGDSDTGSGANTTHTYSDIGVYTAVVTATNPVSTLTATTVVTITDAPITGLSASNNGPTTVGNPTTLMATISSGTNVDYTWDFGDGETGSGANPTHVYPGVGVYTAVVTATNSVSTLTATTIVTIEQDTWTIYLPTVLKAPD